MSNEENKALVRKFVAAADQQDFDTASSYVSPDIVVHLGGMPAPLDFPSFLQFGKMWHAAFPDEQTTFDDQVAEGDKVVSRMTSTGTHTGDYQGIPATGKRIMVSGIFMDWIQDGKIVERRGIFDIMGVMQQLGVIPEQK